jgi:hypothetical protein
VSPGVLYIDQGSIRIDPQGQVTLHICFGPTKSLFCPLAVNPVAYGTTHDECRQNDPIASSTPEHHLLPFSLTEEEETVDAGFDAIPSAACGRRHEGMMRLKTADRACHRHALKHLNAQAEMGY